LKFERQIRTP